MLKKDDPIGNVFCSVLVIFSLFIAIFGLLSITHEVIKFYFPEDRIGPSHLLMGPILGAVVTFFLLWLLDHIKRAYERKLTTVKLLRGLLAEVSMNGFIASGKFVTEPTSEILSPRVFQVDFWKNNVGSFYFLDEAESIARAYVYFYYSNQMENHSNFVAGEESLKRHREFIDSQIEEEILPVIKVAMEDLRKIIREYCEKSIWFFLLNKDFKSDMERRNSLNNKISPES